MKFSAKIIFLSSALWVGCSTAPVSRGPVSTSLSERFEQFTQRNGPGLTYVVLKNGSVVASGAHGYADLENRVPITLKSRFIIASLSKQITAMAILLLEKDGKINREARAVEYLPNLPKYAGAIKVKHLLHHQSGLPDYSPLCVSSVTPVDNAAILSFLHQQSDTLFRPGLEFQYSNSGYVVLAEIISKVSGKPFIEFLQSRIFRKLGMNATDIITLENEQSFQRTMHSYSAWPFFNVDDKNACNYKQGPGGVITNIEDFSKWMNAVASNTLLPEEWTKKMFTPAPLDSGKPKAYADGWLVSSLKENELIWHNGGWLSFRTYAGYVPEKNLWVAIFSNYEGMESMLEPLSAELLDPYL